MKQYILDTNGLLRFILNDIPAQSSEIATLLEDTKTGKHEVTIPHVVFFEATYTLTTYYQFSRTQIKNHWDMLLSVPYLDIPDRSMLQIACSLWATQKAVSFADTVLVSMAITSGKDLITFDKKLVKLAARCS